MFSMPVEELEPVEGSAPFWPNVRRIARLLKSCWPLIVVSLVVMIVKRWSSLMENVLGGTIVDAFSKSDYSDFKYQTTLLTGSYIAYTILSTIDTFIRQRISMIIGRNLKMELFTSLMASKSQAFFDTSKSGDLTSRLSTDCETISDDLGSLVPLIIAELFEIGFGALYMLTTNLKLSGAIAAMLPTMAIATWIQTKWELPLQESQTELLGKVNADAVETIMHSKTVRIFGQQRKEIAKFAQHLSKLNELQFKLGIASSISSGLLTLAYHISLTVTFWYGGSLVLSGEITTGQFLAFSLFGLSISDSVNYLPDLNSKLISIIASSERVYSVIEDTSTAVPLPSSKINPPHSLTGHIKFENVSFQYPSRPDIPVLKDFNLEILPGQSAALVGSSGGGKSTIVSLLTLLYDNYGGKITVDGIDISTVEPNWLRRQIGLVSQEPVLFAGSIRDNICYGVIDEESDLSVEYKAVAVPQERVAEVSKMANAHDFIVALPDGYDTLVGELGIMLSAGQRQRIAIARALLRDPKILIADEATSALDNSSERIVQQALDRLMQGRTCLVIAHRLSTIKNCYPICFVGKGHILERGSHSELLSIPNGHYATLHTVEIEEDHLRASREIQEAEKDSDNSDVPMSLHSTDETETAPNEQNPITSTHKARSRAMASAHDQQ